jgi:hypothetical protein
VSHAAVEHFWLDGWGAAPGGYNIQRVQAPAPATQTGAASISLSWTSATTAGNLLIAILGISQAGASGGGITVTPPSGWTLAASADGGNNGARVDIYYIENAASRSGSESFTSSKTKDMTLALFEYSGLATSSSLDKTSTRTDTTATSSTLDTGQTAATTVAGELLIGALAHRAPDAQSAPTGGFTELSEVTSNNATSTSRLNTCHVEQIASATGQFETTTTIATSHEWAAALATFKGVAVGPQTYTRDLSDTGLSVSDSISARVARPLADVAFAPALASDTFTRTQSGATTWGTADSGGAWTAVSGGGLGTTSWATTGTAGTIAINATNAYDRAAYLGPKTTSQEVVVRSAMDTATAGDFAINFGPLLRFSTANGGYRAFLEVSTTGALSLNVVGINATFGWRTGNPVTASLGTYTANQMWWIRAQAMGPYVRARAWLDGNAEPSTWTVGLFDPSPLPAGQVGYHASDLDSAGGHTITVDDFTAITPQSVVFPDVVRPRTDTGITISDSLNVVYTPGTIQRPISDTGLTVSDSLATSRTRVLSDTGASVSDVFSAARVRALTDTGLTVTDSLATLRARPLTDTGLTHSSTLATSRTRVVSDTGATVTDQLRPAVTRPLADTGLTVTDSLARKVTRPLTDTAVTVTEALARARISTLTDVGLAQTDTFALRIIRVLSSVGVTHSDTFARQLFATRALADTATTITDSLATSRARGLTDTGLVVTDSTTLRIGRQLADTGLAVSAAIAPVQLRPLADTALSVSDAIRVAVSRQLADTALSVTDVAGPTLLIQLTDTGLAVSDAITALPTRALADTALALTDSLAIAVSRRLTDTAVSVADSLQRHLAASRAITDQGLVPADSLLRKVAFIATDTALVLTDVLAPLVRRPLTDRAVTITDSIRRLLSKSLSDTGLSLVDTFGRLVRHQLTDQGLVLIDVLGAGKVFSITLTDTIGGVAPGTQRTVVALADIGLFASDQLSTGEAPPPPPPPPPPPAVPVGGYVFTPRPQPQQRQQKRVELELVEVGASISDSLSVSGPDQVVLIPVAIDRPQPSRFVVQANDVGMRLSEAVFVASTTITPKHDDETELLIQLGLI